MTDKDHIRRFQCTRFHFYKKKKTAQKITMRFEGISAEGAGADGIATTVSHLSLRGNSLAQMKTFRRAAIEFYGFYKKKNRDDEAFVASHRSQVSYRKRLSPSYFTSCQDDRIIPDKCTTPARCSLSRLEIVRVLVYR